MHIEIKQNQIVIEFDEKESNFIEQKAGPAKAKDISNYIKAKIIKALGLEELENAAMLSLGGDFNLDKIKNVSAELKKRKDTPAQSAPSNETQTQTISFKQNPSLINNEPPLKNQPENIEAIEEDINAEVGDEILANLLDKELLKKRRKPNKDDKNAN